MAIEFDCDVEGDGEDGWEDDLEDESDQEPGQALQQADGEGGDEEDEEDMIGPGKKRRDALLAGVGITMCSWVIFHDRRTTYSTHTSFWPRCADQVHSRGCSSSTIPGTW